MGICELKDDLCTDDMKEKFLKDEDIKKDLNKRFKCPKGSQFCPKTLRCKRHKIIYDIEGRWDATKTLVIDILNQNKYVLTQDNKKETEGKTPKEIEEKKGEEGKGKLVEKKDEK